MSDITYQRERLVVATKLLKNSTVFPSNKLKELATGNSNIVIAQDNVTLVGKLTQIRRIYFQSNDLNTVGWVINEDVRNCMECAAQFGVLKRQHHCRQCGNIICHKCCQVTKVPALEALGSVRICLSCVYNKKGMLGQEHDVPMAQAESAEILASEIRTILPTEIVGKKLSDKKTCASKLDEDTSSLPVVLQEAVDSAVNNSIDSSENTHHGDDAVLVAAEDMREDNEEHTEEALLREEFVRTQDDLMRLQADYDLLTKTYNQVNKRSQTNSEAALFQIKSLTAQIANLKKHAEEAKEESTKLEAASKKKNSMISKQKVKIATLEEQLKQSVEYSRELEEQLSSLRNAPCAQCNVLQKTCLAGPLETQQVKQQRKMAMRSVVAREERIYIKQVTNVYKGLEHIIETMHDSERSQVSIQESLQALSEQLKRMCTGDIAAPALHKSHVEVEDDMVGIDSGDYNSPMRM
ncbi:hypothetical protein EON65_38760 [archaeon]|nr:MAG: hypothetical protein EON65_38760 [archaeon]